MARSASARRAYRRGRQRHMQKLACLDRDGHRASPKAFALRQKVRPPLLRRAEPTTPQACAARVRALSAIIAAAHAHLKRGAGWRNRRTLRLLEIARNERGVLLDHLAVAFPALRDALCNELNLTP